MAFLTVDPYYPTNFYNESKEALKNNSIEFQEFIVTKQPYHWYFQLDQKPIMVNYDVASNSDLRWLVTTVNPLKPSDEYLLLRRENDSGKKALLKFVENTPMKEARESDHSIFFTIKNREEGIQLSKDYFGKIWYMGKYYNNRFRVCLGTHETLKGFLKPSQILLEKTSDMKGPGRFESELNWKIFRGVDYLTKFTETPYFENGTYNRPSIKPDNTKKFTI
jgi:hypothetical protein